MAYTAKAFATLTGVSVRTLHYYEEIGLLAPARMANNYRVFDESDAARLQQILLYRDAGMPLGDIKALLDDPDFDAYQALCGHLTRLMKRQEETAAMIAAVQKTIIALEQGGPMSDKERFESMKRQAVEENERAYGEEVRAAYGNDAADAANEKILAMDEQEWGSAEELAAAILEILRESTATGDASGPLAQKMCAMHERWLRIYWPDGLYTREAHAALAEGYVADERFRGYYDAAVAGGAEFLRDALKVYCSQA